MTVRRHPKNMWYLLLWLLGPASISVLLSLLSDNGSAGDASASFKEGEARLFAKNTLPHIERRFKFFATKKRLPDGGSRNVCGA